MTDARLVTDAWLLTDEVVREAVETLTSRPIHQQFVLYLQLRRAAVLAGRMNALPQDNELIRGWLAVPGGPPGKPFFRPFVSTKQPQPSTFWMNPNLAGSYARSSLRPEARALFIGDDGGYELPTAEPGGFADPRPIFDTLLLHEQIPAWALAAFLFRNNAFLVDPSAARPELDSLLEVFQLYFEWTTTADAPVAEYNTLFDWAAAPQSPVFRAAEEERQAQEHTEEVQRIELGPAIREMDAAELGVGYEEHVNRATSAPDAPLIALDDPAIREVIDVLDQYWGVILSGPPGTSKSHRASAVARALANFDETRYRFTQFHQSYQFDDFIEGYRPRESPEGGFERRPGVFVEFCEQARGRSSEVFVFVIDELSRGDVGRVFGEALTYIERSRRNQTFTLPSGRPFSIPENVRIIATMNPLDRGVDEVDAAFERRFGKIATNPDATLLAERLTENGLDPHLIKGVVDWFNGMNSQSVTTPAASVGHTYLWDATDEESLDRTWRYQLSHLVDRAFRLDPDLRARFEREWTDIFAPVTEPAAEIEVGDPGGSDEGETRV